MTRLIQSHCHRLRVGLLGLLCVALAVPASAASETTLSICDFGALGDGTTLNTRAIQSAVEHLAAQGGGTLLIPPGVFLSGAIFLKPGVNLRLAEGAVLKGSTDRKDYPKMKTRIEGHFEEWLPALVNADKAVHLRISGSGTLDGNGAPFWQEFWARRKVNSKTTNLQVPRPRLALIQNSQDVQISGITFKDSGFWNLHLYRCQNVLVEKVRFEVPNGTKCPSTDGTDVDSCQHVTIRGCTYRVDDDCIALKGSKGPFALDDKDSPPVEHIRVSDCTFERGGGVATLGSEATIVRDVVVENCRLVGPINLVRLKLRPDTPQLYEDIHYRNITLESTGTVLKVQPWLQYFDLQGQAPPKSVVRHVTLSNVKGHYGSFGSLEGASGQTELSDITLQDVDVQLQNETLSAPLVKNLKFDNVKVNGKLFLGVAASHAPAAPPAASPPVRLVIVGDSTVCNYPEQSVRRGWGMFLQDYFKPNRLQVLNLALSGRSTKTFIKEGHWAAALKEKPDYVLIQFGHNDSHAPEKPEATEANTSYRQYLCQYIQEARAFGVRPVLVTPMCRRRFQADGRVSNDLLSYANAMKAVAAEQQVPLVDLNTASVDLCNRLGYEASNALANEPKDATHFNAKGAKEMARLVMQQLPVVEPSLKPYQFRFSVGDFGAVGDGQ